jgi:hypothetical protein
VNGGGLMPAIMNSIYRLKLMVNSFSDQVKSGMNDSRINSFVSTKYLYGSLLEVGQTQQIE